MKKIYSILEKKENSSEIIYKIELDFSHPVFKGHFPNKAVFPGVMMCDIIRYLVSDYLNIEVQLLLAKNIKFSKMIIPSKDNNYYVKILIEETQEIYTVRSSISKNEDTYFKINAQYKEK